MQLMRSHPCKTARQGSAGPLVDLGTWLMSGVMRVRKVDFCGPDFWDVEMIPINIEIS
jgi:hypothetical protein